MAWLLVYWGAYKYYYLSDTDLQIIEISSEINSFINLQNQFWKVSKANTDADADAALFLYTTFPKNLESISWNAWSGEPLIDDNNKNNRYQTIHDCNGSNCKLCQNEPNRKFSKTRKMTSTFLLFLKLLDTIKSSTYILPG